MPHPRSCYPAIVSLIIATAIMQVTGNCQSRPDGKPLPGIYFVSVTKGPPYGSSGFSLRNNTNNEAVDFSFTDSTIQCSGSDVCNGKKQALKLLNPLVNRAAPAWSEKELAIFDLECDEILDYSNHWDDFFLQTISVKKQIRLSNDSIKQRAVFSLLSCDSLIFDRCTFMGDLSFVRNENIKKISLENCKIAGTVDFDADLPMHLSFYNLDLSQLKGTIDLTAAQPVNGKCNINLVKTDLEKIKLNLNDFTLVFPANYDINSQENFYTNLVNKFKKEGAEENIRLSDIQYRQFKYKKNKSAFLNFIDNHWWYYGYNKSLIIRNAVLLFFLFFLINLFFYKFLLFKVYTIPSFENQFADLTQSKTKSGRLFRFILDCFLYTGFIFWGFKLDIKNLQTRHYMSVLYILLQYIVGVICVFYIANLILTK